MCLHRQESDSVVTPEEVSMAKHKKKSLAKHLRKKKRKKEAQDAGDKEILLVTTQEGFFQET